MYATKGIILDDKVKTERCEVTVINKHKVGTVQVDTHDASTYIEALIQGYDKVNDTQLRQLFQLDIEPEMDFKLSGNILIFHNVKDTNKEYNNAVAIIISEPITTLDEKIGKVELIKRLLYFLSVREEIIADEDFSLFIDRMASKYCKICNSLNYFKENDITEDKEGEEE